MANSRAILSNQNKLFIHVILAAVFTTYLCYIDEGYYNFNWVKDPGNWIMFVIYTGIFTAFQLLIKWIVRRFNL
jgi:hypothetical protein